MGEERSERLSIRDVKAKRPLALGSEHATVDACRARCTIDLEHAGEVAKIDPHPAGVTIVLCGSTPPPQGSLLTAGPQSSNASTLPAILGKATMSEGWSSRGGRRVKVAKRSTVGWLELGDEGGEIT